MQCVLANLFLIAYARYVDDLFALDVVDGHADDSDDLVGPAGTARLARLVIQDLLGWELDEEKSVMDARAFVALGVEVEFDDCSGMMLLSITEERSDKWKQEIAGYLACARMLPSQARKLAGKLSWGSSHVVGRGARVYLAPLFFHASGRSGRLSQRMRATLQWWTRFLDVVPGRRIPASPSPTVCVTLYADATGHGRLAWVAVCSGQRLFARCTVPSALRRWVHRRRQQVATWELVAALCALWYFLASSSRVGACNLQINLFIHSNVVLGTLLRWSSRQSEWNALIEGIWFQAASRAALLLAWRVLSKLNVADAPTRPTERASKLRELADAGFYETEWIWPPFPPWGV